MPDSPLNPPTKPENPGKSGTRSAMHAGLLSLQKCNLEALRTGEGRGQTTAQMVEQLETESGFRDMREALENLLEFIAILANSESIHGAWLTTIQNCRPFDNARAALAKARGETPTNAG